MGLVRGLRVGGEACTWSMELDMVLGLTHGVVLLAGCNSDIEMRWLNWKNSHARLYLYSLSYQASV